MRGIWFLAGTEVACTFVRTSSLVLSCDKPTVVSVYDGAGLIWTKGSHLPENTASVHISLHSHNDRCIRYLFDDVWVYTLLKKFLFCCRYLELIVPRVSFGECVRHLVPDELWEIWKKHCVCAVLPAAGRLSRHSCHCMERRQLGTGTGKMWMYQLCLIGHPF